MSRKKRALNSLAAAVISSVITSIVIYALPSFGFPSFTDDPSMNAIIFVLGELFLWFVLWYWILSVRDKFKRAFPKDGGHESN